MINRRSTSGRTNKFPPGQSHFFLAFVAWFILLALGASQGLVYAASAQANKLFLPLLYNQDAFASDAPIWVEDRTPSLPEVALFRHSFTLTQPVQAAELHIFADTRYEVWLDGTWVGRGPARFLSNRREYDIYPLETLQPGGHLLAVLVQWAPNNRRSESVAPILMAHVQGNTGAGVSALTSTTASTRWKCLQADAWRSDAALVDTRGLIGPTELLDLRRLPVDWFRPGFVDDSWAPAVVRNIDPTTAFINMIARVTRFDQPIYEKVALPPRGERISADLEYLAYSPRSIDLLVNVPISSTLLDAGLLSPGYAVGELAATPSGAYSMAFQASKPTDLQLELLSTDPPSAGFMKVDDEKLVWQAAGANRPDVFLASTPVTPGPHELKFKGIPPWGVTFSLSRPGILAPLLPFEQGNHAGRRLLLANPVSDKSQVNVSSAAQGLSLEFTNLPAYVVLDLGRTVHGRLQAEVNGPEGSILDIGWDERLWTDARRPLPFRGSLFPLWNQVDSWVLDGSSRSISTIDARAGRYILVAAWGSKSVQLSNIRVLEERYPITQVGSFHSSDPVLDTIWQVGVDTLMPNMTDSYTDTPWRERAFYLGDAYVEYQVNRVSFGDTGLIRRGLLQAATLMRDDQAPGMVPNNNGLHMLDYSMLWVQTLADYLQDTEDADLPGEMLTPLRQFMDHLVDHEDPLTGLLDLSEDQWGNTGYVDTYGYYSRFGQSTAVNAIYYATLLRAAEIAERGGDSGAADRWRAKAAALKEQLNQVLYLPDQDRYVTHIFAGQAYTPTLYAQAWPLAYGLAPEGKSSRVADALLEMIGPDPADPNIGTYGMNWVLKGLGEAGYISQALDVIRLYYGHMLDSGATTWWESFDSNLYPQNSFSHAWAASPTWFLTTYVLGAQRTGQNSWLVKPSFESLDSASGALPLGHGALSVAWQRSDCNVSQSWNIHLDLLAPQGTRGEVVIPYRGAGLILALDHQDVWEAGASLSANVAALDDGIHLLLPGGSHQVEASEACIP